MADDLLPYYERELTYLRQIGGEFAAKYPKIAGRLLLESDRCEDPHVERLIQGVAFLAARVHRKLDDDFPEITEALLGVVYPHYLSPVPSMAIVQFEPDAERGKLTTGHRIERGTTLYSPPINGGPCRFQTAYPVTLWPVKVAGARLEAPDRQSAPPKSAVAALCIELRGLGGATFDELSLDRLRLFLHGESALAFALYEALFNDVCEIQLRPAGAPRGDDPVCLGPDRLRSVGFEADEGLLPFGPRSFLGYRLLQEYFAFPEKFLFLDLDGFDRTRHTAFRNGVDVRIFFHRPPRVAAQAIGEGTFRLGCTPVVNLFEQMAEPIRLDQTQFEYRVVPDHRRQEATEVYSVESVTSMAPHRDEPVVFRPFYALRHGDGGDRPLAYWYATRRASPRKGDLGTEVYLSLVDLAFDPTWPPVETLTVRVMCTNRDLPARLPFGGDGGVIREERYFDVEGAAPLARIRCLTKPTATLRPPQRRGAQWRLISHLSLNYLSLVEGGREALQEILSLYDFSDSPVVRQQIGGILEVRSRRVVGRPASMPWNGFCRGVEVTTEFDEERYVGNSVFLFASVLERFLGLYVSLNSFSQLVATVRQRKEPLKRWPPRSGEQILL